MQSRRRPRMQPPRELENQRSEHAAERMPLEQVAELQVFAPHVEALVPTEPLQLCRMHAGIHAGGQRAALEAVPAQFALLETGRHGA